MQYLQDLALIVTLATLYFLSVYFVVAALAPSLAYYAALIAVIIAMIIRRILTATGHDRPGLPLALLFLAPIICITVGAIWWGMRLLGFWELLED